jgi:ribulose-phosphate 3-epimerase
VTLNPGTPVSALEPVLQLADLVLVMSVNPGFSNQAFLPDAVGRVAQLRKKLDEMKSTAFLEVDGGITPQNLVQLKNAGANVFVSAHAVFSHPQGIAAGMAALRLAADQAPGDRTRPA